MISTTKALKNLIPILLENSSIALDTEFYWRYTYYPKLCLIQIALENGKIFLIDTLSQKLDLSPLSAVFASPSVCKIIHAADNDIRILKHAFQTTFQNVFDTQLAVAFLSRRHQIALKTLLDDLSIHKMNKQEKLSDWRIRPLSHDQITYAKTDVMYLHQIKQMLQKKLVFQGKYPLFCDEMNILCQKSRFLTAEESIERAQLFFNNTCGKTRQNVIALVTWREHFARQLNRLPQHILTNGEILQLAKLDPTLPEQLQHEKATTRKRFRRYAKPILKTLAEKIDEPPYLIVYRSLPNFVISKDSLDEAYNEIQDLCCRYNISLEFVTSKNELQSFIRSYLDKSVELQGKIATGWRFEYFGKAMIYWIGTHENRLFAT